MRLTPWRVGGSARDRGRPGAVLVRGIVATAIVLALGGCADLPVPVSDPYQAAPPTSAAPWRPPVSASRDRASGRVGTVQPDPDTLYGLADLIDLAHHVNPDTRRAWEGARAAAAQAGRAEAAYYPTLNYMAAGGTSRVTYPTKDGPLTITGPGVTPQVQLSWIILDFGRRRATVEGRGQQLLQANYSFNRKLQEVAFAVARSYFALDASRARVTAARATLESAVAIEEAVAARLAQGLATRPDLLLARQERARAAFDVEDAVGAVADAQALLAESVGIAPTLPLKVADLSALPLPAGLTESVEDVIDRALIRRPDLSARLAALRAREAEVARARAEFLPNLSVSGSVSQPVQRYSSSPTGQSPFTMNETNYGAFLNFEWKLFDGFERDNALREAASQRGAAEAELAALELRTIREVWKAYVDVKTALSKREFALALVAAAEEAYAATLESYRAAGLATVLDLLAAQRDLARARTTEIQSRAELLTSSAALTFAAGD